MQKIISMQKAKKKNKQYKENFNLKNKVVFENTNNGYGGEYDVGNNVQQNNYNGGVGVDRIENNNNCCNIERIIDEVSTSNNNFEKINNNSANIRTDLVNLLEIGKNNGGIHASNAIIEGEEEDEEEYDEEEIIVGDDDFNNIDDINLLEELTCDNNGGNNSSKN